MFANAKRDIAMLSTELLERLGSLGISPRGSWASRSTPLSRGCCPASRKDNATAVERQALAVEPDGIRH